VTTVHDFSYPYDRVLALIEAEDDAVDRVISSAHEVRRRNGRVFFIGNGGSAAIASHMAIDFLNKGRFAAMAFNDGASLTCLGNDHGYDQVFIRPFSVHVRNGDILFAVSSSGKSESVINPALHAGVVGASVVTLSGFAPDNRLRSLGSVNFYVPSESYGVVETAHLAILHAILDRLVD